MSDFGGFDFVVGSVTGRRVWKVDENGQLRGIVHDEDAWTADVNHGKCMVDGPGLSVEVRDGLPVIIPAPFDADSDHIAGCGCGFYGYFAHQENVYMNSIWTHGECTVDGVVEAYGKTVLGTKGFRASKARIVALCLPPYHDPVDDVKAPWLVRWIERRHDWSYPGSIIDPVGLGGIVGSILSVASAGLVFIQPWLAPLLAALFIASVYAMRASFGAIDYHFDREIARRRGPRDWTERYELVRANYPDIPVYDTVEAMLAARPVTPPPDIPE